MYVLDENFRMKMGLSEGSGLGAIEITAGIDGGDWAEKEFGGAPLGDERLSQRLVEIAADKAEQPARAYCGVAEGDLPKVKAYYRFIDKPDDSAVSMSAILRPHRERTIQRMKAQKTVLCIQDGSDLNYSTLERCEGLGFVVTNQTGKQSKGLQLHSTFAVTSSGLPLGVLRAECTARGAEVSGRRSSPIGNPDRGEEYLQLDSGSARLYGYKTPDASYIVSLCHGSGG